MRFLVLIAISGIAALAGATASAAVPGSNLTWENCSTAPTSANWSFACDDNTQTRRLVCSFRLDQDLPDFIGVSAKLDFRVNDAALPPWWSLDAGGCREGSLVPINVGELGGCVNPYPVDTQDGGYVILTPSPTIPGNNTFAMWADWTGFDFFATTNGVLYSALVLELSTSKSVDQGPGSCAGCFTPACVVLQRLEVFGGTTIRIEQADVRNWATYQGGQVGADICPFGTPARASTWGQIKALYR